MFVAQVKVNPTTPPCKTTRVVMVKHELFCLKTGFKILCKSQSHSQNRVQRPAKNGNRRLRSFLALRKFGGLNHNKSKGN